MTSRDFVIWMKGFMEACNDYTATPKQWDRIKEELSQVDDDENLSSQQPNLPIGPGWGTPNTVPMNPLRNPFYVGDVPGWMSPYYTTSAGIVPLSGSITTSDANFTTTVWNDQMGNWHYTNYPEGFGYYTNSTIESKKEKQQLND
jgi:hypothetical protein